MIDFVKHPINRGLECLQSVTEIIAGRALIGGSYAAHMATYESDEAYGQPGDIDVFAFSDDNAEYIIQRLKDADYFESELNSIAISMSPNHWLNPICDMPIQVIKPNPNWRRDPVNFRDDLLNSFDLNVCRAVLDGEIIIGDVEIGSTQGRVLRVANPVRTMKRIMKYRERGFTFSDWELCKVFLAFGELSDERLKEITDAAQPQPADYDEHYDWYDDDDYFNAE